MKGGVIDYYYRKPKHYSNYKLLSSYNDIKYALISKQSIYVLYSEEQVDEIGGLCVYEPLQQCFVKLNNDNNNVLYVLNDYCDWIEYDLVKHGEGLFVMPGQTECGGYLYIEKHSYFYEKQVRLRAKIK